MAVGASGSAHLAALAGADPIVVPRGLVLAHEAGLVDAGQGWGRGGAGHDLLRAGALRLDGCGEGATLRAWSTPPGRDPSPCTPRLLPNSRGPGSPSPVLPTPALAPGRAGPAGRGRVLGRCNVTFPGHRDDVEFRQTKKKREKKKSKEKGRDPRSPQPRQHWQRMGGWRVQGQPREASATHSLTRVGTCTV